MDELRIELDLNRLQCTVNYKSEKSQRFNVTQQRNTGQRLKINKWSEKNVIIGMLIRKSPSIVTNKYLLSTSNINHALLSS